MNLNDKICSYLEGIAIGCLILIAYRMTTIINLLKAIQEQVK